MNWLWTQGRLGWPLVALIVFSTVLVLAFDYCWRLIKAPFWEFALAGLSAWIVGVAVIVAVSRGRRGKQTRRRRLHEIPRRESA